MDLDREPLGKGVDDGCADAVQAAGDLIAAAAEFAARMQDRIDDLERGAAGLGLNVHGDAAAVIGDGDGVAGIDRHGDVGAVARKRLVDGVVHDLIDQMVQAAGGRRADIHARTFPDGLQPLQDLDLRGVVFLFHSRIQQFFRHELCSPFVPCAFPELRR